MNEPIYDVIVCGAGTAGCLLANRLSADRSRRVLLIEAGGNDNYPWIHIPVGYLYCIGNPRTDWLYATEADPGLNGRSLRYPRGKVLGGCSSINGMIYMRGQALDYDGWRQQGNAGWGWDDVLPYFRRSEHHHARDDAVHGQGGEWRVERQRLRWPILDAVRDAALELGRVPAVLSEARGLPQGCRRPARRAGVRCDRRAAGRRVARREAAPALGHPRRVRGRGAAGRHSRDRRLQPR
jgi:choline dehydrogenase